MYRLVVTLTSQGVHALWGVKQVRGEETSHFLALNVNISKKVEDTSKVTIND